MKGPLFRTFVLQFSRTHSVIGFVLHHTVADAFSVKLLAAEIFQEYSELMRESAERDARLPFQYFDYVQAVNEWTRSDAMRFRMAYWRESLSSILPTHLASRPLVPSTALGVVKYLQFHVTPANTSSLREAARTHHVSLFTIVLASYLIALSRCCAQRDILTMVIVAGRDDPQLIDMVGNTVNLIPVRITIDEQQSAEALLERVSSAWQSAISYQVPSPFIEEWFRTRTGSSSFTHLNFIDRSAVKEGSLHRQKISPFGIRGTPAEHQTPATLGNTWTSVTYSPAGIIGDVGYLDVLYNPETIQSFASTLTEILMQFVQRVNIKDMPHPARQ